MGWNCSTGCGDYVDCASTGAIPRLTRMKQGAVSLGDFWNNHYTDSYGWHRYFPSCGDRRSYGDVRMVIVVFHNVKSELVGVSWENFVLGDSC